jgi:hypothetical protein
LTAAQRARAVEAIYLCDDALRGWGYEPLYEIHGDLLWKEAQKADDAGYRYVAVRFGECIFRRLTGSMIHEVLHASFGDSAKANYGMPFALPYGVPRDVPESEEASYLAPFNFCEARAFVGVWIFAREVFGIDFDVRTARDIGTYGFVGGNALVPVGAAYRPVAHIDPIAHRDRYVAKGRKLEEEARAWFTAERIAEVAAGIRAAAARAPKHGRPSPDEIARIVPKKIGRNDPCPCGSAKKVKACCGDRASSQITQTFVR